MTIDLETLARLDAEATAGPWTEDDGNIFSKPLSEERNAQIMRRLHGENIPHPDDACEPHPLGFVATTTQYTERFEADCELICFLRNSAPALASELRALREALAAADLERDVAEQRGFQRAYEAVQALLLDIGDDGIAASDVDSGFQAGIEDALDAIDHLISEKRAALAPAEPAEGT